MKILIVLGAISALAFAGCSANANTSGSITYAGNGDGSESATKNCGNAVNYANSGAVTGGSVTVTVKDSVGATKLSRTISPTSVAGSGQALSGSAGDWTISAVRSSGFAGTYSASVSCK